MRTSHTPGVLMLTKALFKRLSFPTKSTNWDQAMLQTLETVYEDVFSTTLCREESHIIREYYGFGQKVPWDRVNQESLAERLNMKTSNLSKMMKNGLNILKKVPLLEN